MASLLASAQATWAGLFKTKGVLDGPLLQIVTTVTTDYRLWLGGALYVIATLLYFLLVSKINFFVVQLTVTGLVIIFSTLISYFVFKEQIQLINVIGIAVMFIGIYLIVGFKG